MAKIKVRLTRRMALEICRDLWRWVAETNREKSEWPGWDRVGEMESDCPCCEYETRCEKKLGEKWRMTHNCASICLLKGLWGPKGCCDDDSPFERWDNAKRKSTRIKYAKIIADYCKWLLAYHRPCSEGYTRGCPNAKEGLCYCRKWIPGEHNGHCGRTSIDCQGMG